MKIVVLDSDPALGSLSPTSGLVLGELACPDLIRLGEVKLYSNTPTDQIIERCRGATVVVTNKVPLGETVFAASPSLKLVSVLATGVNVINLDAAKKRNIVVSNVPGYSTASTAQHTIALMLELVNRVGEHHTSTQRGDWTSSPAFSYFLQSTVELEGKTLGILGMGAIGQRVAQVAQALGMRVITHTRTVRPELKFSHVTLEELLINSDVLSLHCPLTTHTHHIINARTLKLMKNDAYLINVARGPIVDEVALAQALAEGRLRGVATDVLSEEPPRANSPLLGAPNCIITPHLAWASVEARQRLLVTTVENISAFIRGTPQNVVS